MSKSGPVKVRCFWTGTMFLTNGKSMAVHCTHLTKTSIEVESPFGLQGSKLVKLELQAMHEGRTMLIKTICDPVLDVLNEHDQHYITLKFHSIGEAEKSFIADFIKAHS